MIDDDEVVPLSGLRPQRYRQRSATSSLGDSETEGVGILSDALTRSGGENERRRGVISIPTASGDDNVHGGRRRTEADRGHGMNVSPRIPSAFLVCAIALVEVDFRSSKSVMTEEKVGPSVSVQISNASSTKLQLRPCWPIQSVTSGHIEKFLTVYATRNRQQNANCYRPHRQTRLPPLRTQTKNCFG